MTTHYHGDPEGTPEFGWVIEHGDSLPGTPQYYCLKGWQDRRKAMLVSWSTDHMLALRFAREEDARDFFEAFIQEEMPTCRVVEHGWDI